MSIPAQADFGRRHKSPFLAWFLSWLVPGGKQGYNGQWGKAAAFFVPAMAGFALVAANDGFSCSDDCGTRDVGLVILAVSSIGSQIEAPIAASKINREARKRHLQRLAWWWPGFTGDVGRGALGLDSLDACLTTRLKIEEFRSGSSYDVDLAVMINHGKRSACPTITAVGPVARA